MRGIKSGARELSMNCDECKASVTSSSSFFSWAASSLSAFSLNSSWASRSFSSHSSCSRRLRRYITPLPNTSNTMRQEKLIKLKLYLSTSLSSSFTSSSSSSGLGLAPVISQVEGYSVKRCSWSNGRHQQQENYLHTTLSGLGQSLTFPFPSLLPLCSPALLLTGMGGKN